VQAAPSNKLKGLLYIFLFVFALLSCNKARKCQCVDVSIQAQQSGVDTAIYYINGNKKDSKKACTNLADSTETCTLLDK
jgi:hypothetical protein